jgi:hypothetical protein
MAKQGLKYYQIDVGIMSDIKIRKILKEYGPASIGVLQDLLCRIYSDKGYYINYDEDLTFIIADNIYSEEDYVFNVISKALSVGFFNKELFDKYKILTSKRIQENYLFGVKQNRKYRTDIKTEYCLVDFDENLEDENCNRNDKNVIETEKLQSKDENCNRNDVHHTISAHKIRQDKIREDNIREEVFLADSDKSQTADSDADAVVISFLLNDKSEFPIYEKQIDVWRDLYPAVDILQDLRNIKGWCEANPKQRKTKTGALRFVNSWLSRTQNRGWNTQNKASPLDAENGNEALTEAEKDIYYKSKLNENLTENEQKLLAKITEKVNKIQNKT